MTDEWCERCPLKGCARIDLLSESAFTVNKDVLLCCKIQAKMKEIAEEAVKEMEEERNGS